jgi:polysaccharide export outer membrane protein
VFIFRFEPRTRSTGRASRRPRRRGLVPVIYNVDLRNPSSFFVIQSFAINDKDVVYVSNAGATELQNS